MAVSYGNSPRREPRDITTTDMCTHSAQSPNITSSRAGHASAVGGLPSTALELAPGDINVARSAAQVPDGLDVDQMCFHITYAEPAARSPTVPRLPGCSLLDGPARIRERRMSRYEFGAVTYGPEPGRPLQLARRHGLGAWCIRTARR